MVPDLQAFFLPELRGLPVAERSAALRLARGMPFSVTELLGMAGAIVIAAALAGSSWLAMPLGAALVLPFALNRLRRGLRKLAEGEQP